MGGRPAAEGSLTRDLQSLAFQRTRAVGKELPAGTGLGSGLRRLTMGGSSLIQLSGVSHSLFSQLGTHFILSSHL